MGLVAKIGHLIAHACAEVERPPILQLRLHLALNHVENVTSIAPMIGEIAGRIFDSSNSDVSEVDGPPNRPSRRLVVGPFLFS